MPENWIWPVLTLFRHHAVEDAISETETVNVELVASARSFDRAEVRSVSCLFMECSVRVSPWRTRRPLLSL